MCRSGHRQRINRHLGLVEELDRNPLAAGGRGLFRQEIVQDAVTDIARPDAEGPMTMLIYVDTNKQFCRGYPAQSKSCDGKRKITDAK